MVAIGIVLGIGIGIALSILFNRYKPIKKVEISKEEENVVLVNENIYFAHNFHDIT